MAKKDPRIDSYIQNSAPFAKPILRHLRLLIHKTCPQVEETIKWGMPNFVYQKKILCAMAAFKAHCTFGFWKGSLIVQEDGSRAKVAMGDLGRISGVQDLPSQKTLTSYIKQAMKLNEPGARPTRRPIKHKKPPVRPPKDFVQALKSNPKALETFEGFSTTHKRDYVDWILEAKTEETRAKRLETSIEWLEAGKTKNWKYIKP